MVIFKTLNMIRFNKKSANINILSSSFHLKSSVIWLVPDIAIEKTIQIQNRLRNPKKSGNVEKTRFSEK